MQTLKHIVVGIIIDADDVNPLFGIPSELEDMRNKNIIETIEISVSNIFGHQDLGDDLEFEWGGLDEVLTAQGWFSLKRVSLTITIHRVSCSGNLKEMNEAMRKLVLREFPRLSSSNSVSFNFKLNLLLE